MKTIFILVILFSLNTSAATYYVSKSGNNINPGTQASPFQTIVKGISVLKAGDTLLIRGGVYPESINTNDFDFPSGTSWTNAINISAYPNEIVTMNGGGEAILNFGAAGDSYIIFDRISFDAINASLTAISLNQGTHHVRFQNCEIKNAGRSGVYINWGNNNGLPSNYNEFIDCDIHNNGRQYYPTGALTQPPGYGAGHGLYITSQYNILRGNRIHHNGNFGVHVYFGDSSKPPNGNIIESNRIYNNGNDITRYGGPCCGGVILSTGSNNIARNNLIYDNPVIGIEVWGSPGTNQQVYNNTIYRNGGIGLQVAYGGTHSAINNILYLNPTSIKIYSPAILNQSNNLTTDPGFEDAANGIFTLRSTSAARDKGVTLSGFNNDFSGVLRPQGAAWDIGAYEFVAGTPAGTIPKPPTNLRVQ
jgi:hypothetical protein